MIDLPVIAQRLAELIEVEERIIDRGPIKVIPRLDPPNIPALQARMIQLLDQLRVRRNYGAAKGHDLGGDGQPVGYDLTAVGVVEDMRNIPKGKDRALPKSTIVVLVGFPSGEHLWFDPTDLVSVVAGVEVPHAQPGKPPKAGSTP